MHVTPELFRARFLRLVHELRSDQPALDRAKRQNASNGHQRDRDRKQDDQRKFQRNLQPDDEEQQREYGQYQHETKGKKQHDLRKKRMVSEAAESTWKMVQDSNNLEDFRYFLEQFPDSPYAIQAKLKLKQLERGKE